MKKKLTGFFVMVSVLALIPAGFVFSKTLSHPIISRIIPWKSTGIKYHEKNCDASYTFKGWVFTQIAHMGKQGHSTNIPSPGFHIPGYGSTGGSSGGCDCITAKTTGNGYYYYDSIGNLDTYMSNDGTLIAVWAYLDASNGKVVSNGYYYRCLARNNSPLRNSKIHKIDDPIMQNTYDSNGKPIKKLNFVKWARTHVLSCE